MTRTDYSVVCSVVSIEIGLLLLVCDKNRLLSGLFCSLYRDRIVTVSVRQERITESSVL